MNVMTNHYTFHIVGGTSRDRAEQASMAFALGHHAEIYEEVDELVEAGPTDGIILASNEAALGECSRLMAQLEENGICLPVVMTARDPVVEQVVCAVKCGVIDYLSFPYDMSTFARRIDALSGQVQAETERRRVRIHAKELVDGLSKREGEVLQGISAGNSNKEIARLLDISPRTVEIHRANMMSKLGANHPADAVRLWLAAQGDAIDLIPDEAVAVARGSGQIIDLVRPAPRRNQRLRHLRQRQ